MTDNVAELGFAVDSKPLDEAKQKLQGLGDQAVKTSDSIGKLQPSMQTLQAAAKNAGVSVEEMRARTAAFNAESAKLASSSQTAGTAIGAIAREAGATAPALNAVSAASASVTKEHDAHTTALGNLRSSLQGISPLFTELSSGVGQFVLAAGGAAISLAKLGDEIQRNKTNFEALTGSAKSGLETYGAVKDIAQRSGIEFDTLSGALQKAAQGQDLLSNKSVIYVDQGDRIQKFATQLGDTFGELGKIMQRNGATAEEEAKVFDALGSSIQKTGGITEGVFQTIRDASLPTARALANAFGFADINEFQKQLGKTPISAQEFIDQINRIKPAIDANFEASPINTVEQAVRQLKGEWKLLLNQMADDGQFNFVIDALKRLSSTLQQDIADARALASALSTIGGAASGVAGNMSQVLQGQGQGGSDGVQLDAMGGVTGGEPQAFSGGNTSASPYGGTEFMDMGPSYGNDTGAIDYGGGSADYGYFATGGQFTVGGDGGTDTTPVFFHATKGEVVTVSPPSSANLLQGAPGTAIDAVKQITDAIGESSIDITKKVLEGSDNIVSALNKLSGDVASSAINPATGLPIASTANGGTLLSRSLGGGAQGGGGFNTRKSNEPKQGPEEPPIDAKYYDSYMGYNQSVVQGRGQPVGAATQRPRRPQQRPNQQQPYQQQSQPYGGFPRRMPRGFDSWPIGSPVTDYDGTGAFNGTLSDFDAGMSDFYGTNYDGSGMFYGSLSDYDAGMSNFYGTDYGGSGDFYGSISDVGTTEVPYGSGGIEGFSDLSYGGMDYGGGSSDYGYFAKGGKFTVGGDGGTDTTNVLLHATKGETVEITPAGVANPVSFAMPVSDPSKADASSTTSKIVNIHVQAGIQAESFIKSRAQIARGF